MSSTSIRTINSLISRYADIARENQEQFMRQVGNGQHGSGVDREWDISNVMLIEERDNCYKFINDLKLIKRLIYHEQLI